MIEDVDEVREGLVAMLNFSNNFESVTGFSNTESVLSNGLGSQPQPDLAIVDLGLPGKSGIECMVILKTYFSNVKVLIFTVYDSSEKVFDALRSGADGYLLKQESIDKILAAIQDAFNGGAPMSREIARMVLQQFRNSNDLVNMVVEKTFPLSEKENQVLELLAKGLLYKEIAQEIDTSVEMIKHYAHTIYKKLQVNNRTEATIIYLKNKL